MKIVINKCYGSFAISKEAAEYMAKLGCERAKKELEQSKNTIFYGYGIVLGMISDSYDRTDPLLIKAVEVLKEKANGYYAKLKVVEIPDDIDYIINEYYGFEKIHEIRSKTILG